MAEQGLQKSTDFAKVQSIDFAARFSTNINQLMTLLGLTRKIKKEPGKVIETYKVVGSPTDGNVGEGETIPLSHYATETAQIFKIKLKKYRKVTSMEAIGDKTYEQAVDDTDTALMKDLQNGIRGDFYSFLVDERTPFATKNRLQAALAALWTKNQVLWEDTDASGYLYFVSPEDIGEYLEGASITTQTAFGMTYIQGFLGIYDVVSYTGIPKGKVFSTAKENIILYYLDPREDEIAKAGFEFITDQTGYIAIHRDVSYSNLTAETVMWTGLSLYAEIEDGIICAEINSTPAASPSADVPAVVSVDTTGIAEAVANGVTEALGNQEPAPAAAPEKATTPETVDAKSTTAQLEAYAEAHGIDLSGCTTNSDRLDRIRAAEAAN